MTRSAVKGQNAGVASADRERGICKQMIVPWDWSKNPTKNDRAKKIGSFDQTPFAAIHEYDKIRAAVLLCDGFIRGHAQSKRPLEPDNWALRFFEALGKGKDNQWHLRLIADHDNPADERTHRGTMVINQCGRQRWGWLDDVLWAVEFGTPVKHRELDFDDAGYLRMARTKDVPTGPVRGAVAVNISSNAGFAADPYRIGHLAHVFSWHRAAGAQATTSQQAQAPCTPPIKNELGLCGEVPFNLGGRWASLAFGQAGNTKGDKYAGLLRITTNAELASAAPCLPDTKTNHQRIPRAPHEGIGCYIQKPQEWFPTVPIPIPTGFPNRPTVTGTPTLTTQSGVTGDGWRAGVATGLCDAAPIPESIDEGKGYDIAVNFLTPAAGIGVEPITLQVDWVAFAQGSAVPGAVTGTRTVTLDAATYPGNGVDGRALVRIDGADLRGKEGGKLMIAVYRRGDTDRNVSTLVVLAIGIHFGDAVL